MTVACDISEYQVPVNDSYPHRWITFRACDGSYVDRNAPANLAWCQRALTAGRLDGYGVYVVYRPGANAAILATLSRLGVPTGCTVMVDAESWGGQIRGDNSAELNALANALVARQGAQSRVWGYGNRSDLSGLWPGRPSWLGVVVASYGGSKPTGIPNMVGWQYTDGQPQYAVPGLPSASAPFGPCDHNELYLTAQGDPPVTPAEIAAVADAVWGKVFSALMPDGKTLSPQHSAAEWLAGTNIAERDDVTAAQLAAAVAVITAAIAKIQTGPGGAAPTYQSGPLVLTPLP